MKIRRVYREIGYMHYGGSNMSQDPATVTNNPVEIARTFWQMFQALERGEKVGSRYTELFIRTGQTVPSKKH